MASAVVQVWPPEPSPTPPTASRRPHTAGIRARLNAPTPPQPPRPPSPRRRRIQGIPCRFNPQRHFSPAPAPRFCSAPYAASPGSSSPTPAARSSAA
ncbi:hypothetical protein E2562_023307 [Oryza meyeriana var. granulata]|uniref:Uncharacterized protein n=1 Tax=Oryza meyeriana var. granulata TaxID=110450 RepID=A0A6G1DNC7_9ORYZ|nr:hypothetical protein E2562_023307 [Oryza meyeriana var. granulata]